MIAHLDCSTGVSGDKFLGALLDAGAADQLFAARDIQAALSRMAPEAHVTVESVRTHGLAATTVRVDAVGPSPSRRWADVRRLIETAGLPDSASVMALKAFEELARAEAKAHGVAVDDVHFHEVGAIDSILDVVGTALGLHALGISKLIISPIATGWGSVNTSHGLLSVPAPATALLLTGAQTVPGPARPDGSEPGELTTPTGAALARAAGTGFGPCPALRPERVGYGAGTRDIGHPNVCRLIVGEAAVSPVALEDETVVLLETNIDHISPEAVAFAAEQLIAEGALDVWVTPIVMKKGRAALLLSVLTRQDDSQHFAQRTVALTGSLGVRVTSQPRLVAPRAEFTLDTQYGSVDYKSQPDGRLRPEADHVARIAGQTGQAFADVHSQLMDAAEARRD